MSTAEAEMRNDPAKQAKFDKLRSGPYFSAVVEANRAYLAAAVPDPAATERERWVLTCLPGGNIQRLSVLDMRTMEVLVLLEPTMLGDGEVTGYLTVRPSVLRAALPPGQTVEQRYPRLTFRTDNPYHHAGEDQVRVFGTSRALVEALADETFAAAARALADDLLTRRTNHSRHHNYPFADAVLGRTIPPAASTAADTTRAGRRAWLVRGSNVDGADLVPRWLDEGWVSLAASQLPESAADAGPHDLAQIVEEAYRHKSYSVREKLRGNFEAFLRSMRPGDYVLTAHRGEIHLGLIDGTAEVVDSPDRRANLRRPVRWLTVDGARDLTALAGALPTLIQSQDDLIDLTDALDEVERLYAGLMPEAAPVAPAPAPEARLRDVTQETADELFTDLEWLTGLRDLLAERRQVILYGPPGTGKTYLANKLAKGLTDAHAVQLVQFHPSYTYEDFFEGFRPQSAEDGTLRFKLTSGPLRRLADTARENPSVAYVLIIDEINRGNLAKIFGELYFLLEYRAEGIQLQYSAETFTLPKNLYLIGTMNTADRSIDVIDSAMRRRFAFVELHPSKEPVDRLLRRWLHKHGHPTEYADLLDALNARLADADYAIGPSFLMRPETYAHPDGLARVWRYDILPLLVERHYGDGVDVEQRYGLAALRAALPPTRP